MPTFDMGRGFEPHSTLAEGQIFGKSILPIQLVVVVVLRAFRPGGICATLKILTCEIVVLGVDVMVVVLRLVCLSKKAVQG
jgi:hypothetical protein